MTVTTGRLQLVEEDRGTLGFLEFRNMSFVPRRIFWLKDVPAGSSRGAHAHRVCSQFVVCLQGSVHARAIGVDGSSTDFELEEGAYCDVPPLHWLELDGFSDGAVVVVLASHDYEESDYIRSRTDFDLLLR